jgi:septal ring factor EnvC (AmiA/AmiB activator)
MNEECKDCIQAKNLDDKIKALWHQITESKEQRKDFEKRITDLERKSDVTEEKFDRIFTAIEAIEKNIEKIANSLECIQSKPGQNWNELIKTIIVVGSTAAITYLIKK